MRLVTSRKNRTCKKCPELITCGDPYYPQRHKKAICFDCGYELTNKVLIMKLNDLNVGDKFILVRSGEKYIKAEYQRDQNGKGLKRSFVIPLDKFGQQLPVRTLSLQCKVKLIIRFK